LKLSKTVTDLHRLEPRKVFELFISDCLLPSMSNVERLSDIFPVWVDYCTQMGYPPVSATIFGRFMVDRYRRTMRKGQSHYYCEFKEGIFDESE